MRLRLLATWEEVVRKAAAFNNDGKADLPAEDLIVMLKLTVADSSTGNQARVIMQDRLAAKSRVDQRPRHPNRGRRAASGGRGRPADSGGGVAPPTGIVGGGVSDIARAADSRRMIRLRQLAYTRRWDVRMFGRADAARAGMPPVGKLAGHVLHRWKDSDIEAAAMVGTRRRARNAAGHHLVLPHQAEGERE